MHTRNTPKQTIIIFVWSEHPERNILRVDNCDVQLTRRQYKFNLTTSITHIPGHQEYIMSCDFVLLQIIVTVLMFGLYYCLVIKHVSNCIDYILWFCTIHQNIVTIMIFVIYCCLVPKHVNKSIDYFLWFLILRSMMFHFWFLPYCPSGTIKLTINSSVLLVLFFVQCIM